MWVSAKLEEWIGDWKGTGDIELNMGVHESLSKE